MDAPPEQRSTRQRVHAARRARWWVVSGAIGATAALSVTMALDGGSVTSEPRPAPAGSDGAVPTPVGNTEGSRTATATPGRPALDRTPTEPRIVSSAS